MMQLQTKEDVKKYLLGQKLITGNARVDITHLSGGVSSEVWKIISGERKWILKQALEKLRVQADWFSDVERIHREHEVMQVLRDIMPERSVPEILHTDYINHVYLMKSAEESARTWKEILMNESFDADIAIKAGEILRSIHINSDKINTDDKEKFRNQKYFVQLRVEPFHQYLIQKHPTLKKYIQQLIDEVTQNNICLVHGDFSPKNMLIEQNNHLVLIDYEVAHWGNPVFDVAYCVGHLMLKGWHLKRSSNAVKLIDVFLNAYNNSVENLIPHLGLMLLARMDGKSPVDYIKDSELKNEIRKVGIEWIKGEDQEMNILSCIKKAYL